MQNKSTPSPPAVPDIDLKDRRLAAFLAWLMPGAGHLYQRRTGKGLLFMVCILGTFFFGLYLGQGRVVYASMRPDDRRLPYFCQIGVGLPALPALVQAARVRSGKQPLWGGWMAPPKLHRSETSRDTSGNPIRHPHELARWHYELHTHFELGTVYTMIAGLLNVLVVFDAWGGPLVFVPSRKRRPSESEPGESPAGSRGPRK